MRPQRFKTHYVTETGCLMLLAETYFVLVRLSDGHCRRFNYSEFNA